VDTTVAEALNIKSHGATDVGMKRRHNEDVYLIDQEIGLFLVADGMGGHAAGEVASKIAADSIRDYIARLSPPSPAETWPEHWDPEHKASSNMLRDAILSAHQNVMQAVDEDPARKGMGTTVVVAFHEDESSILTVAHVGDSRAYRLRKGKLEILTQDHSWVHEQVVAGLLTEEAGRSHPLKNVVTQALGGSALPQATILETPMIEGDLFLLCSDGLNTMLEDREIGDILRSAGSLEEIASRLILTANERGGNDNTTIVLLQSLQAEA